MEGDRETDTERKRQRGEREGKERLKQGKRQRGQEYRKRKIKERKKQAI